MNNGSNIEENRNGMEGNFHEPAVSESLFQVMWRRRWIILVATVLVVVAGFVYLAKATPLFTAASRVYVEQSGPKIIEESEGIMTRSKNYLYTQAELLKSTPIVNAALEKPEARDMQIFHEVDNRVAYVKKNLEVSVGEKDDLVSVSFETPYPEESATLVNAVVDSYITYHSQRKKSTAAEVLKILRKEKQRRDEELSKDMDALVEFKTNNEALAFETNSDNVILQRLVKLSDALSQAQMETIEKKSNYEAVKSMSGNPSQIRQLVQTKVAYGGYNTNPQELTSLNQKLDELKSRLEELKGKATGKHPAVEATQDEIDRTKEEIKNLEKEFSDSYLAVARQEYLAAKEKEEELRKRYQQQRQQAIGLNKQLAKYKQLESEYQQTKKLCDILGERIKELNITEETGALNISILEVAHKPEKASSPQKARVMGMALVLGLMLGGGLALLRDWTDTRFHSSEEVSALLGTPVLGIVPLMARKKNFSEKARRVALESDSPVAEAYRTLRTALFFGVPKGEAKTILVTSPGPAEGKTTLVSNLAISMAQSGQKTLVIDADFRKPNQHRIFGTNKEIGLANVLAGECKLEEAVQATKVKSLGVLCAGPEIPNPAELLNSDAFKKLLDNLGQKYDRIILDSPPVTAVTDAQILAAFCDLTLLVVRAEKSTRQNSQQACGSLLGVGANILGAVVNCVHKRNGRYGYYYYRYGYRKKESTQKPNESMESSSRMRLRQEAIKEE